MWELSWIETLVGIVGIVGWFALVFAGIIKIALLVKRKEKWKGIHIYGLFAVAALSAGIVLTVKNLLPHDTIGVGALIAIYGGIAIWVVAYFSDK